MTKPMARIRAGKTLTIMTGLGLGLSVLAVPVWPTPVWASDNPATNHDLDELNQTLKRWLGTATEFVKDNVGPPMLADDYARLEEQNREEALWGRSMAQDQDDTDKDVVLVENAPHTPIAAPIPVDAKPAAKKTIDTTPVASVPATTSTATTSAQAAKAVSAAALAPAPSASQAVAVALPQPKAGEIPAAAIVKQDQADTTALADNPALAKVIVPKLKDRKPSSIAATATVKQARRLGATGEIYGGL